MEAETEIIPLKSSLRCTEFTLMCALAYLGFPIEAFDRNPKNPERVAAIFRRSDGLDEAVEAFWGGRLKVEPNTFWQTTRQIKGRIRAEISYGDGEQE